ncbi:protein-export chaperone SecB [Pseudooceanicola sp.]|uniref:protein-export chaperone SecB n=1 Tax=Pseudooceanicola sp. TaxID=1914328 RepID=UPI00262AFB96|nr:protein-export chaperone SecB [Pseudooceanicola sp.]MDF1854946.1 protein-export chaperone SecB [Pseudooceanicola sp.]
MTDANGAAPAAAQPEIRFTVLNQYIRDMSFENILCRKPAKGEYVPNVEVQVGLQTAKREVDHQYEVAIKLNVNSSVKDTDTTLFLLEVDYVGLFHIEGVPDDQLQPFLLIECPRQIFPFLRRIVSDVTRDGGFPPLNLENIDFLQLFRQEMARRSQVAQA